jgi:hypothetical protein
MQERSGRERLDGATRGARGQESHGGEMIVLGERAEPGGPNHLRPVGPGRSAWPINGAPGSRLLQTSSPLLP